jgi:hypothetical protein
VYDKQGKKIKEIRTSSASEESVHMANFVDAVRSRKRSELTAEAEVGHVSAACSHMANISHRLGKTAAPSAIRERMNAQPELMDALERCEKYLHANGVDLNRAPAVLGPWVTWDGEEHKFVGEFAEAANQLDQGVYRKGFEVPRLV